MNDTMTFVARAGCATAVLFACAGTALAQAKARAVDRGVNHAGAPGIGAAQVGADDAAWQVAADVISASPAVTGDGFGSACAMNEDGSVLVVGASDASVNGSAAVGCVHIYQYEVDGAAGRWVHHQKLECPPFVSPSGASQTAPGLSLFGWSVAISGQTIVVGAPVVTPTNGPAFAGRVYVFQLNADGGWGHDVVVDGETFRVAEKILAPSDPEMIGYFGGSVAVDVVGEGAENTRIAVGSPFKGAANQGGVYVFEGSGSTFAQKKYLIPEDVVGQDNFGSKVAINGSLLVVGVQNADTDDVINSGAVYVYRRDAKGLWPSAHEALLLPANGARDDGFGSSVAVLDSTIAVGAPGTDRAGPGGETSTNNGSAYVYRYEGGLWSEMREVFPREANGANSFGFSVALASGGNRLLVGAPGYETTLVNAGTGFTFDCDIELECWDMSASDLWTTTAGTSQAVGEQAAMSRNGLRVVMGSRNNATPALLTNKMFSWDYSADPLPDPLPVGTPPTAQSPGADGVAPGVPTTGTPPGGNTPSTGGFGGIGSAPVPATPTIEDWGVVRASVIAVHRDTSRIMIIMTDGNGQLETAAKSHTFLGSFDPTWEVLGLGDVNGDGSSDVLFHVPATRKVKAWIRLGSRIVETVTVGTTSVGDRFIGISDWTGNGFDGPAFLRADGVNAVFWVVQGGAVASQISWVMGDGDWAFRMCDVNADDRADIIALDRSTGVLYKVTPTATGATVALLPTPGKNYSFASAQDYDKDGTTDFLWENRDTGVLEFVFPNSDGSTRFQIPWDSNLPGWRVDPALNFTASGGVGVMFSKGDSEVMVLTVRFEPLATLPSGRGNIRVDYARVIGDLDDGYTVLGIADEP